MAQQSREPPPIASTSENAVVKELVTERLPVKDILEAALLEADLEPFTIDEEELLEDESTDLFFPAVDKVIIQPEVTEKASPSFGSHSSEKKDILSIAVEELDIQEEPTEIFEILEWTEDLPFVELSSCVETPLEQELVIFLQMHESMGEVYTLDDFIPEVVRYYLFILSVQLGGPL